MIVQMLSLQASLAEVDSENERKKVVLRQKDKEIAELKKVCTYQPNTAITYLHRYFYNKKWLWLYLIKYTEKVWDLERC